MQEEINASYSNKTWILVPKTAGMNIVGSKWVFKTKLKADGTIDRHKAKLLKLENQTTRFQECIPAWSLTRRGSNHEHVSEVTTTLGKEFEVRDLVSLHFFLDIEVKQFSGGIHLSQGKYAVELLYKTNMTLVKAVYTPLAQKHGLQEATGSPVDVSLYKSIVGSLQYLTLTRPDITHAVNLASQFMQNPNSEHLQGVKRILRYVKGTLHHGLRIISQSTCRLYGYSDADWGGCTTTRRSTTSYNIYLGANCISWASKKQSTVVRSSAEAEYRALASTVAEMTWITYILHDIGVYIRPVPILYCDNLSALYMTVNPVLHVRTKHVEMDYHFVREKVARGQLLTRFVTSKDQLAHIHTKALTKQMFIGFRSKLEVTVPPSTSLRGSVEDKDPDIQDIKGFSFSPILVKDPSHARQAPYVKGIN
ncbi:uncharacterized mitochondrial protein AtMg00810-like [Lycium barbarum]|uniref:uncharacterized mitochondrial protein AtMg00810-like n=1 Tax=Lycium barbarum TaxID=112863 RepID=UPI00293EA30E|nr:uncharacterized mitochondrial protein AtMg00810-like [Lycium barbarum]